MITRRRYHSTPHQYLTFLYVAKGTIWFVLRSAGSLYHSMCRDRKTSRKLIALASILTIHYSLKKVIEN